MAIHFRPLHYRLVNWANVQADPKTRDESFPAKVIRYVPGEIVAAYVAAASAINSASGVPIETLQWIITVILALLAPLWILYVAGKGDIRRPNFQAVAATVGFVVWVFALGGPFIYFEWYHPLYGSLSLIVSTLLFPVLDAMMDRVDSRKTDSQIKTTNSKEVMQL